MFSTSITSRRARRKRLANLRADQGAGFQIRGCPRRKLTLQALFVAALVLLAPFTTTSEAFVNVAYENTTTETEILAIDSPTFSLDMIAVTEDGFLIKNAGQTVAVDRSELSDILTYTVESGDSLYSIARRFGVSSDTIVWENNITSPHSLKIGSTLNILPVSGITHTVKASDTAASVAKRYGLSVEKLVKQNQLGEDTTLTAGSSLIIPGGKRVISTTNTYVASASTGTYAAYTPPTPIDGSIIVSNGVSDKTGKWMIKPTEGVYTTYFGSRRGHWAVDIADRSKPDIFAAADGTIVKSQCGWNGGYGCMAVIDHGDGFQTLYAHMADIYLGVGDKVFQGTAIGQMGNTGRVYGATGIHLHFEVIDNGSKKNPLAYY